MERMRFRESCPSLADRSPAFHQFIPPRIRLASLIPPGRPTVVCLSDRGDLHLLLGQDPVPVFGLQKSFHPLLPTGGDDESDHLPRPLDEHLFQRPAVGAGHERQDIVDGAALKVHHRRERIARQPGYPPACTAPAALSRRSNGTSSIWLPTSLAAAAGRRQRFAAARGSQIRQRRYPDAWIPTRPRAKPAPRATAFSPSFGVIALWSLHVSWESSQAPSQRVLVEWDGVGANLHRHNRRGPLPVEDHRLYLPVVKGHSAVCRPVDGCRCSLQQLRRYCFVVPAVRPPSDVVHI